MFTPPYCPYKPCNNHHDPHRPFFVRHGTYRVGCRPHPVPRFRCRSCRRTFSRQTFRVDYRDHRPHLNQALLRLITSGLGLRQSSRNLNLSLRCTELKFRKLARHLRRLNLSLRRPVREGLRLHFDEFETFEADRSARPLTVPVLIESDSRYVIWAESAPIRPRGRMTKLRLARIQRSESIHGKRRNGSERAVRRTLKRALPLLGTCKKVVLHSDEKLTYPPVARGVFGAGNLDHRRTSSKLARLTWNPLFAINHEEAILRDLMGRLRRRSWLVSKKRRYLDLALQAHAAYRNFVRYRFNRDGESPAQLLGLMPRRLSFGELLSWRQERGKDSIHPLSRSSATIREWERANGPEDQQGTQSVPKRAKGVP